MVWGCISKGFKSDLLRIEGKLDANSYQKVLSENKVIEKLDNRFGKFGYVFKQDGASPHRAKSTTLFLADKVTTLPNQLHWPSSSPDLSVIEICWAILKAKINVTSIKTADELFQAAVQAWNAIPQESINAMIDSFDARLTACVKINGESLNGRRKLIKLFQNSIADGDNYLQKQNEESAKLKEFVRRSRIFFKQLERIDLCSHQVNRNNYDDSRKICDLLPERIKRKTGLPS